MPIRPQTLLSQLKSPFICKMCGFFSFLFLSGRVEKFATKACKIHRYLSESEHLSTVFTDSNVALRKYVRSTYLELTPVIPENETSDQLFFFHFDFK